MKTFWNGTLELGRVAIPVGLATTVRDGDVHLRRLHDACKTPISLRSYCTRDEELLDAENPEVVHGWEIAKGEFVVVDADERAALEPPESRRMPIGMFVAAGELDPLLVIKRYYLVPSDTSIGRRAYRTIAEAMHELDVVAIVRFVAWQSEQLGAVTSRGARLELATLAFAEDLVDVEPIPTDEPQEAHLELARELVERHTRKLKRGDLESLDRPRIRALLEAKLAGDPIVRPEPDAVAEAEPVQADLGFALEQSLKQAPRRRRTAARV